MSEIEVGIFRALGNGEERTLLALASLCAATPGETLDVLSRMHHKGFIRAFSANNTTFYTLVPQEREG